MTTTNSPIDDLILIVEEELRVEAPTHTTFEALIEQLGPAGEYADGSPNPMILEAWPGGRWFRDMGTGDGHFWAVVQAIKRPTLLEFAGPLFMSYPVTNNVQFRLSDSGAGTVIKVRHSGLGLITDDHKRVMNAGWKYMLERLRSRVERSRSSQ